MKIIIRKKETELTVDLGDDLPTHDGTQYRIAVAHAINSYKTRLLDNISALPERPAKSSVRRAILDITA